VWILCKNFVLRINQCLCYFDVLQKKKSQKFTEEGIYKCQDPSEL